MLSPEDTGYDTTGSVMRAARAASRRELIKSKRPRNTELLPETNEEEARDKVSQFQILHLRDENRHLRNELETRQSNLEELYGEVETIHHAHQQEIEQYQQNLREMMEELNQMQEANRQWEHRYQELYHSFQDEVEEEANKMVKEAAQTLVLSPEHTPALLNDVVRTLEEQVRQTEDQRTVEVLAVLRQAQYKSELLEQEIAHERAALANEQDNIRELREHIHNQARERFKIERTRLRTRWKASLTFISLTILLVMVVLESLFYNFHLPLSIILFVPLAVCLIVSYIFAHLYTMNHIKVQIQAALPKNTKKNAKAAPKAAPAKAASAGKK